MTCYFTWYKLSQDRYYHTLLFLWKSDYVMVLRGLRWEHGNHVYCSCSGMNNLSFMREYS